MSERLRPVDEAACGGREEPSRTGLGAAVDRDVVPGYVARHVRREKQRDARLVFGPAEAADRRPRWPEMVGIFEAGEVVDLRRLREVGADGVHSDTVPTHVDGQIGRE